VAALLIPTANSQTELPGRTANLEESTGVIDTRDNRPPDPSEEAYNYKAPQALGDEIPQIQDNSFLVVLMTKSQSKAIRQLFVYLSGKYGQMGSEDHNESGRWNEKRVILTIRRMNFVG
jgi:hypothetical protein